MARVSFTRTPISGTSMPTAGATTDPRRVFTGGASAAPITGGGGGAGAGSIGGVPSLPKFQPISLPGIDQGTVSAEADLAAAAPLRLLSRGVREAITQAGSEFGDDPIAQRFAVRGALRGFQEALGPTLQAARQSGLSRAEAQQRIQAQEVLANQQAEQQRVLAQFSANVAAQNAQAMRAFQERMIAESRTREDELIDRADEAANEPISDPLNTLPVAFGRRYGSGAVL